MFRFENSTHSKLNKDVFCVLKWGIKEINSTFKKKRFTISLFYSVIYSDCSKPTIEIFKNCIIYISDFSENFMASRNTSIFSLHWDLSINTLLLLVNVDNLTPIRFSKNSARQNFTAPAYRFWRKQKFFKMDFPNFEARIEFEKWNSRAFWFYKKVKSRIALLLKITLHV